MFKIFKSLFPSHPVPRRARTPRAPAMERLEDRLLLSVTGYIDYHNASGIGGWVLSTTNLAASVQYRVDVNGTVGTTQAASDFRADLAAAFGSGAHAFFVAGNYTNKVVDIWAWDPDSNAQTLLFSNNRAVTGYVDVINSNIVSGWVYDPDLASSPAQVRIDVDGVTGSVVSANKYRGDLTSAFGSPNHAFMLDPGKLSAGNHTIQVYAIDPGSTSAVPVLIANSTITNNGPSGSIDVLNSTSIVGWAYSTIDGPDSIFVDVDINGTTASTVTAGTERDDVGGVIGSSYHGFAIATPALNPGTNLVQVYARDSAGTRTLLAQKTIVNQAPIAYVDQATSSIISGWTIDLDTPTTSISYRLDIDGVTGSVFTASNARSDLIAPFGSANHGFAISGSFAGHTLELYALDTGTGTAVLVYTNNQKPTGYVDSITATSVSGWVFDPDNASLSSSIRVDIDSTIGTPVAASNTRGDLAGLTGGSTNHGFAIPLVLDPGKHTIKVYAIDATADGQAPVLLATNTVTNTPPVGSLDSLTDSVISGWAYDPDAGSAPINVTLYVNKVAFATVAASGYRSDLTGAIGSPNHAFTFDTSSLPAGGSREITITMHDSAGSASNEVTLYDGLVNNHPPEGYLDVITSTTLAGWAYDSDAGSAPIDVDFYVDGVFAGTTTANRNRPDLASLGSTSHGFSVNLPALGFGSHKIEMFAVESFGTIDVKVAQATMTNFRPVGGLLSLDASTITGWAYDADIPSAALSVQLVISNIVLGTYVANVANSAVTPLFNSPNHGFSIAMPTLSTGTYEVAVYAIDPNNGLRSAIISTTITV